MKKSLLIGLVVLLLIGGGAAAYVVKHNKDKKKTNASTTTSQSTGSTNANSFSPVSTNGLPYEATITSQGSDNTTTTATIKSDGKGVTQYSATTNGQTTEITYTSDSYYICSGSAQCIKYPLSQSGSAAFDPSAYNYTDAQLTGYRSGATYKGKQSCPSGTCDTWSVSNGGTTSTLFIDSGSKRITEADTTVSGKTSKVVYNYKDVSITVPTNVTTLPSTP